MLWGLLIDQSLGKINRGKSITLNLVSSKTGYLQIALVWYFDRSSAMTPNSHIPNVQVKSNIAPISSRVWMQFLHSLKVLEIDPNTFDLFMAVVCLYRVAMSSGVLRLFNSTLAMLYMRFKLGQYCGCYIECKFGYRI